jgi:hypothetical protein
MSEYVLQNSTLTVMLKTKLSAKDVIAAKCQRSRTSNPSRPVGPKANQAKVFHV